MEDKRRYAEELEKYKAYRLAAAAAGQDVPGVQDVNPGELVIPLARVKRIAKLVLPLPHVVH